MVALLGSLIVAGCSSRTGPKTVEATGKVSQDGDPLSGATVVFHPAEGSKNTLACQAITDDEGRFALSTYAGGGKFSPGIAPGQYLITITRLDTKAIRTTQMPPKNLLPKKYADPNRSGFTAEVSEAGPNEFSFAVESDHR